MKWGRKTHLQNAADDDVEKKRNSSSSSSSSSHSTSFSLSHFLPFSWISKRKPKPPTVPIRTQIPDPINPSPPRSRSQSDHLSFSPAVLDRLIAADHRPRSIPKLRPISSETDRSDTDPSPPPPRRRLRRRRRRQRAADPTSDEIEPPFLKPIETGSDRRDPTRNGRRSFSGKVRPRVRVCSPRLKRGEERERERALESFAVVKRSSDPQKDFRDSMVEMIWEKGIGRPEEMESLLACYLSLNSDEHHDVIVKVFRQVWFDLNREAERLRALVM